MASAFAPSGRTGPVPSAKLRLVSGVFRTVPRLMGHAWPWWRTGRCSGREARSARSFDADDDGVDVGEVLAVAGDDADVGGAAGVAVDAKFVPADRAGAVAVGDEMDDGVDRGAVLDAVSRGGLLVQPASITATTEAMTDAAFRPGAGHRLNRWQLRRTWRSPIRRPRMTGPGSTQGATAVVVTLRPRGSS